MPYTGEKVTKDALTALLAENLSEKQIAQVLGVAWRTVGRAMVRHGLREKVPDWKLTEQEIARIRVLAAEQMPVTWIAEDIGRAPAAVSRVIGPDPERDLIWKQEWQYIRRSERMLELNDEIRPKRDRYAA